MEKEKPIYFKELILRILLRWRLIFVWMLIGAVLAGFYGAVSSYQTVVKTKEELSQISQEPDYTQYVAAMPKADVKETEDAFYTYCKLQENYESCKEYYDNSILMHLDSNAVPTIRLVYQIVVDKENKVNINELINLYEISIKSEENCEKILNEIGISSKTSYIKELISIYDLYEKLENEKNNQKNELIMEEKNEDNALMVVNIQGENEQQCKKISEIIAGEMNKITNRYQKIFNNYKVNYISDNFFYYTDRNLFKEQKDCINDMNLATSSMRTLKVSLTETQKNYLNALLDNTDEAKKEKKEVLSANQVVVSKVQYINIKLILAGFLVGAFLAIGYLACKYLFTPFLFSHEEIKDYFDATMLGKLKIEGEKNNRINEWLMNIFHKKENSFSSEEKKEMVISNIRLIAQKKQLKHIHITGSVNSKAIGNVKKLLKEELKNLKVEITIGSNIHYDAESLEQLTQSDGVVFIEQIGESFSKEIDEEIEICNKYGIEIIGIIVME